MRILLKVLTGGCLFLMGATACAEGFLLDKVSVTLKNVNDEEMESQIDYNSNVVYDWMELNLSGKLYGSLLSDNYEDDSQDESDDEYSRFRATCKFPQLSKNLKSTLGYEWNQNYQIYSYGLGYPYQFTDNLMLGGRVEEAFREALRDDKTKNNYDRNTERLTIKYQLNDIWDYNATLTRSAKNYPNSPKPDFSSTKYTLEQKLIYQASSKLKLDLAYRVANTDYTKSNRESIEGEKIDISGDYHRNKFWTWNSRYSRTANVGWNGHRSGNIFRLDGKYQSNPKWSITSKTRLADYDFSKGYQGDTKKKKKKDADYLSREELFAAMEYQRRLEKFSYMIESFVKNYDYQDADEKDKLISGIDGALMWQWARLNWSLQAAPNGSFNTRKGWYQLKVEYQF